MDQDGLVHRMCHQRRSEIGESEDEPELKEFTGLDLAKKENLG